MKKARAIAAMLTVGLLMTFSNAALADDEGGSNAAADPVDPGIAALHQAIDTFRDARSALRAQCAGAHDKAAREECRTTFAEARTAFKASRVTAVEQHHVFREAQKAHAHKGKPDSAPPAPKKP